MIVTVATAATLAIAAGAPADARADSPPIEPLRLECAVRTAGQDAAVRCEWSAPTSDAAAVVRLWRFDPATDRTRHVIFRTDDLGVTEYIDIAVRRGHRYTYVVQAVNGDGRMVARSRAETVGVPDHRSVERLRLVCELAAHGDAVGCTWSTPASPDAEVVELWRSVDGRPRQLVERFRPSGPNAYRDTVPEGAATMAYAVLARDADGGIVARSRVARVRIPDATPTRERLAATPVERDVAADTPAPSDIVVRPAPPQDRGGRATPDGERPASDRPTSDRPAEEPIDAQRPAGGRTVDTAPVPERTDSTGDASPARERPSDDESRTERQADDEQVVGR